MLWAVHYFDRDHGFTFECIEARSAKSAQRAFDRMPWHDSDRFISVERAVYGKHSFKI